jgi:hypothetical protein
MGRRLVEVLDLRDHQATRCVSEVLQSLSVPTSLGKKMTRPELFSTRCRNLHVRDPTGDDAGLYLYRRRATV